MSSPLRLLRKKQSVPLPSQYVTPPRNESSSEFIKRKQQSSNTYTSLNARPIVVRPAANSVYPESVKDYLRRHKSFLEDFLLYEVPASVLRKILMRKSTRENFGHGIAPTISDVISKWKLGSVNRMRTDELMDLSVKMQKDVPFKSALFHLCKSIAQAAHADSFQLYITTTSSNYNKAQFLTIIEEEDLNTPSTQFPVDLGDTLPGYVAVTGSTVDMSVLKRNPRDDFKFPNGSILAQLDSTVAFVLCAPIVSKNGGNIGVIELGRRAESLLFDQEDMEIVQNYLHWAAVTMQCSEIFREALQSQLLCNTFMELTKSVTGSDWCFESIFDQIQSTVTHLVGSESTSIFMLSQSRNELCLQVPRIFMLDDDPIWVTSSGSLSAKDIIQQAESKDTIKQFPRVSIREGVVGFVARTGKMINVKDTSRNEFYCKEVDNVAAENLAGKICKTLLCIPISINRRVLGVIEAINKKTAVEFSSRDEELLRYFCTFCGLIINECRLQKEEVGLRCELAVTNEMLEYHQRCSEEVFQAVNEMPSLSIDSFPVKDYNFDSGNLSDNIKVQLVVTLFSDLVDISKFNSEKLLRFVLTICKNHRPQSYHNWDHAFSVTHFMYLLIKGAPHLFSQIERIGLFLACLCHDLDHRGTNNSFLSRTNSPMAKLYHTSFLENHRLNLTFTLLQTEEIDILSDFTDQDYQQISHIISEGILATDLALFGTIKETMSAALKDRKFSWDNPLHKKAAHELMVVACDINNSFKSWKLHKKWVDGLMNEFLFQGDSERTFRLEPLPIMDRNQHDIPIFQVDFFRDISLPSSQLLKSILPHTKMLEYGAMMNMGKWKEMITNEIMKSKISMSNLRHSI